MSICSGEAYFASHTLEHRRSLSERASALEAAAHHTQEPLTEVAQIDWSLPDDGTGFLDEWLENRVNAFEAVPHPSLSTSAHFNLVVATVNGTTLDANMVCFPAPEPLSRPPWRVRPVSLGDVEAAQVEARGHPHKAAEVAMWGRFDEARFILPGSDGHALDAGSADIGLIPSRGRGHPYSIQEDRARQGYEAELARTPEQLRVDLHETAESTGLDTSLPDGVGAAWARWAASTVSSRSHGKEHSLYGEEAHVISNDSCTEEQLHLIECRQRDPHFWEPARVRARALRRKVLPGFLQAAPDLLEREAAQLQLQKRRSAEKRCEAADFEKRAAEGAAYTCWPSAGLWDPRHKWGPRSEELAAASLQRLQRMKDVRTNNAKCRPAWRPELACQLLNAVSRGDVKKAESIIAKGRVPALLSPEIFRKACALRCSGTLHMPLLTVGSQEEGGRELLICQINGTQLSLMVDPMCNLRDVLRRVNSSGSKIVEHTLRFLTHSGVLLQDKDSPLSEVFGDEEWVLTALWQAHGSLAAAQMFELLREARSQIARPEEVDLYRHHGLVLLEDAAAVGNTTVVEMLLDGGVNALEALQRICNKVSDRSLRTVDKNAVLAHQTSFMLLISKGMPELCATSHFAVRTLAWQIPLILQEIHMLLPLDTALWLGLTRACGCASIKTLYPESLLASHSFMIELVKICGCASSTGLFPESLLASRNFLLDVMMSESDWFVVSLASKDVQMDEEVLAKAVMLNKKAISLVPKQAWTGKLAWSALEQREYAFLKHLPAQEWSQELAWEALKQGAPVEAIVDVLPPEACGEELALELGSKGASIYKMIDLFPLSFWSQELVLKLVAKGTSQDVLIEVLPEHLWSESVALEMIRASVQRAAIIPAKLWTKSLAHRLCQNSSASNDKSGPDGTWQALLHAPRSLRRDQGLRARLVDRLRDLTKETSCLAEDTSTMRSKLSFHRELLLLASALRSHNLFKKELTASSLESYRVALDLQSRLAKLHFMKGKAGIGQNDSSQELVALDRLVHKDIQKQLARWKVLDLAKHESLPDACVVLLYAVRCLVDKDLHLEHPQQSWGVQKSWENSRADLSNLQSTSCTDFLARMAAFDVASVPMSVIKAVSELTYFPHAGSGRTTTLWALQKYVSSKVLVSLAAWVNAVLQLRLRDDTSSTSMCPLEAQLLHERLADIEEEAHALETHANSNDDQKLCEDRCDLEGQLEEKLVIVAATQLLEDRISTFLSKHHDESLKGAESTGSRRWQCHEMVADVYTKTLNEASALKGSMATARDVLQEKLRLLSKQADTHTVEAPSLFAGIQEPLPPIALKRAHSFSGNLPSTIVKDARSFLQSSSWPPHKFGRHQLLFANKPSVTMLKMKLPPLTKNGYATEERSDIGLKKVNHELLNATF
eukprot:TRINITY_DN90835_c0_g1_i1.p1 TRINITY_DN90835_c0_g1~~TRINITY_DN90835_c0_g1_i1.p1  ORF type:complete len:1406 (-),score=241.37 TRINITY_DN90835_c0_g1_i1:71-4288(-)